MHSNAGIGERLRDFAKQFGGPSGLAKEMGISPQQLNDYLSGRRIPGNKMQERLRELGCDTLWLITGKTKIETDEKYSNMVREQAAAYGFGKAQYPIVSQIWAGKGGTKTTYEYDST